MLLLAATLAFAPPPSDLTLLPRRTTRATRVHETMKIDGHANETVWHQADFTHDFIERWPGLGKTPPVPTSFAVAYDDANLYVLVRGKLAGNKPVIRTLRRDSFQIYSDDAMTVKIDPQHDRRSAYMFSTNLAGTQVDTLTLEDGRDWIDAWDGVWEIETHVDGRDFTYEYRIPFYILGIKGGREITMGINVSRDDPKRGSTYDWQLIVPPRSPGAASTFGNLVNLRHVDTQRALEFLPYAAGRTDFSSKLHLDPRRSPNLAAGLDMRIQTGKGSYAEASFLTDFSQVDLDNVQVANNRFALFYPERRPFFLNGLEIFNFGSPGEAQLFFSRRIGLNGRAVPIASGIKAYGRAGPIAYGFLNVQTLGAVRDPRTKREAIAPENFVVARVRADVGTHLNLGAIALGNHRFDSGAFDSVSAGMDAETFSTNRLWRAYGFVAASWSEKEEPQAKSAVSAETPSIAETPPTAAAKPQIGSILGTSAHATAEYRGLYFRPSMSWMWSDKDFQAPLGFYRRPGTTDNRGYLEFAPRPNFLGLNEVTFGPMGYFVTDPAYTNVLTQAPGGYVVARFRVPWRVYYEIEHTKDKVADDFTLYGFPILASTYHSLRQSAGFSTPDNYAVSGELNYSSFDFFSGHAQSVNAALDIRMGRHVSLSGSHTQMFGSVGSRDNTFNFGYSNAQVILAATRNLIFDSLIRFNLEPDSRRFGLLSRVRWRYRPGSDLFVVYRHDLPLSPDKSGRVPKPIHEITFKLTFYARALFSS